MAVGNWGYPFVRSPRSRNNLMSLLLQAYSKSHAGLNIAATAKDKDDDFHGALLLYINQWKISQA